MKYRIYTEWLHSQANTPQDVLPRDWRLRCTIDTKRDRDALRYVDFTIDHSRRQGSHVKVTTNKGTTYYPGTGR